MSRPVRDGADRGRTAADGRSPVSRPPTSRSDADRDRGPRSGDDRRPSRPPAGRSEGPTRSPRPTGARSGDNGHWAPPGPKGWGSLARKGARNLQAADERPRSDDDGRRGGPPPAWEPEDWQSEGPVPPPGPADTTTAPSAPPPVPERPRRKAPKPVADELVRAVGAPLAAKMEARLVDAASAFERGRPQDALRVLRPLLRDAPDVASVRELAGLACYRLGRWAEAARHLEAFRAATGSFEQHPVLADCYRALGRYAKVDALWEELREASPEPELVVEGRIVAAGALADRGDVKGAIRLLERGPLEPRRVVRPYHVRLWYALADLHERAGDTPRARELFARVVAADAGLADAAERLQSLG